MSTPKFRLFPNGTSYMMWMDANCERCVKGFDWKKHPNGRSSCGIENAIAIASGTDGSLLHRGHTPINKANAIAKRLNWDGVTYLEHNCPEFVP